MAQAGLLAGSGQLAWATRIWGADRRRTGYKTGSHRAGSGPCIEDIR